MGFFSDIRDKIFNRHHDDVVTPVAPTPTTTTASAQPTTTAQAAPAPTPSAAPAPNPAASPAPSAAPQSTPSAAPTAPTQSVDVGKILDQAVKDSGQTLNWRTSIVDLMKALGIDSSLASRKELAKELEYTGDTDDSATMNLWLHKQVLAKLAANGGTVPADLLD